MAANRVHYPYQHRSREIKRISGRLSILGNATPANGTYAIDKGGDGVTSVVRSGTGEYTFTLETTYCDLNNFQLTLEASVAVDLVPSVKNHTVKTTKTIVVRTCTGATPTDTADAVQQYIHFSFDLKNTSSAR